MLSTKLSNSFPNTIRTARSALRTFFINTKNKNTRSILRMWTQGSVHFYKCPGYSWWCVCCQQNDSIYGSEIQQLSFISVTHCVHGVPWKELPKINLFLLCRFLGIFGTWEGVNNIITLCAWFFFQLHFLNQ